MSNETKRDVFDEVVAIYEAYLDDALEQAKDPHPDADAKRGADKFQTRYSAALPDDLPVIPEAVGEWLAWCKNCHHSLKDALDGETRVSEDVFARAWVLGAWRVEETGEIVKLEAEK